MYTSNNTLYGSNENLTISTEATTTPTLPAHFVNQYEFDTKLQAMFDHFNANFDKQAELFDRQHEKLVNIISMSL